MFSPGLVLGPVVLLFPSRDVPCGPVLAVFVVVPGALKAVESHLEKIVYFGVRVMRSRTVF